MSNFLVVGLELYKKLEDWGLTKYKVNGHTGSKHFMRRKRKRRRR